MNKAKITFKGQVTIPKEIREALTIQEGDTVIFEVEGDHALLKPLKKTVNDFTSLQRPGLIRLRQLERGPA
jgi:AbrB family looped-hinge helix DNA binding protein